MTLMLRSCLAFKRVPQRLFSCLQVKSSSPVAKLATPKVQRMCLRFNFMTPRKVRKFRPQYAKDKVSKDWVLIYDGNMNRLLFWSQSLIYLMIIPTNLMSMWTLIQSAADIPWNLTIAHPASSALAYLIFGTSLLLFVNFVCRRSIQRIYRDPISNTNIAIVQNWAMVTSKLEFHLKDCTNKEPTLMKAWAGNVNIRGRPFFVFPGDFSLPMYYNQLRGWEHDRPIEVITDFDIKSGFSSNDRKVKNRSIKKN